MNKTDLERIQAIFERLGCTPRETKIYLTCLRLGAITIQEIARDLKQNRVTVHSAVETLLAKWFLFESRAGKRRLIVAESPYVIDRILQKRENELKLLRLDAKEAESLLLGLGKQDRSVPSVKFYEGVDGLKKMLEGRLQAQGEVLVFSSVNVFSELLDPIYLEGYFVRRAKLNIHTRLIFPPCEFASRVHTKAQEYKIQVRLIAPDTQWKSGIFSWNNVLALQSFTEGKITCTFIENEDLAYFYRHIIFDKCWQLATPITR